MAGILRISDKSQTDYVNILDGIFKVRNEREMFAFLDNTDGVSFRSFKAELVGKGPYWTSLTQQKKKLEKLIRRAVRWHGSSVHSDSIWLEWSIDGESPRRALIYKETKLKELPGLGTFPMRDSGSIGIMLLDFLIQLHPAWEDIGASVTFAGPGLSTVGGSFPLTTLGTLPARIERLTIDNIGGVAPMGTHWIGIRPFYEGLTNFQPVWELEDGTIIASTDTSSVADAADASGGNALETTFATVPEFAARANVRISDVIGSDYNHMRGEYQILLRYKAVTSAASSFSVQIRTGFSSSNNLASNLPIQTFDTDDTDYHFLELGIVEIPFGSLHGAEGDNIGEALIELWLERISGSASFRSDCFVLIPSTHYVKIEGAGEASATSVVKVFTHENDDVGGVEEDAAGPARGLDISPRNWYVPFEVQPVSQASTMVIASQRAAGNTDIDDTLDITAEVTDRWSSYQTPFTV